MAITGTLSVIPTDFSAGLGQIVSACTINMLRVNATLSGGTDTGAYCIIDLEFQNGDTYSFNLINRTFNGTTGEFYFDFSEILPAFFTDVSDDVLESGNQEVIDTFTKSVNDMIKIKLFNSSGGALDIIETELNLLFSSKQLGLSYDIANSLEDRIYNGKMPNFIAQKGFKSYIYYYGSGTLDFTKADSIPDQYIMMDNNGAIMIDNNNDAMISEY